MGERRNGNSIVRKTIRVLGHAEAFKPIRNLLHRRPRVRAGLLFRQGAPPHASYLFKHALIQDAAYGTLLREPRRALHARIVETLESGFADIAENQPEILARHCTDAGWTEKAVGLWGKAGQRSLERSALVEASAQFTQGLDLITTLPATPALRREQIKLQVALITPLMHIKGYSAQETKAAAERARLLIEQAERLGEPLEDPLLLFSVLYGFCLVNILAFNGDVACDLAAQFLALAEKQRATIPLMVGHRLVGSTSAFTGDSVAGRAHYDRALALYDGTKHRSLAARFGQDVRVSILSFRSITLWMLGYPEASLTDVDQVVKYAREMDHAPSLMYALLMTSMTHLLVGNYAAATAQTDELLAVAEEKNTPFWKAFGRTVQGCALAEAGEASDAVHQIASGIAALRSTGTTWTLPSWLSYLGKSNADLRQFDDACVASVKRLPPRKQRWKDGGFPRFIVSRARSRCGLQARTGPRPTLIFSVPSILRVLNRPNRLNCARR
jgi:hypothetical protein